MHSSASDPAASSIGDLPIVSERHLVVPSPQVVKTKRKAKSTSASKAGGLELAALASDLRSQDHEHDKRIVDAVATLEQHGKIPSELYPELICVLQNPLLEYRGNGRKNAKKLFAAYAPEGLREAVATHLKGSIIKKTGETKVAERLTALARAAGTVLDIKHLVRVLMEDHGIGLKYVMAQGDCAWLAWALAARVSDGCLDISFRQLEVLPDCSLLKGVRAIGARQNNLTAFPIELPKNLESIDVGYNKIDGIPPAISAFKNLAHLDLRFNNFESFPEALCTLASLRELRLSGNAVATIPKQIGALAKLRTLDLKAGVAEIPDEITSLKSLRTLELSGHRLSPARCKRLKTQLPKCEIHFGRPGR